MRISLDAMMLGIAHLLSERATCMKLKVGCVLVNGRGHIIGTGYNGVAHGLTHCIDVPCAGADAPAGSDLCEAVHAEQNALLQCRNVYDIHTAYVTHAPCMRCTKQLLNTSCSRIIFSNGDYEQDQARALWIRAHRNWNDF